MMEGKTKFFWLHGVSRSGVRRALSDSKRSIYYRRTFRQALVIVSVIATSTLVVAAYLSDGKTQTYIEGVAFALTIVLYMLLRKSCRLIAESPAELLWYPSSNAAFRLPLCTGREFTKRICSARVARFTPGRPR